MVRKKLRRVKIYDPFTGGVSYARPRSKSDRIDLIEGGKMIKNAHPEFRW